MSSQGSSADNASSEDGRKSTINNNKDNNKNVKLTVSEKTSKTTADSIKPTTGSKPKPQVNKKSQKQESSESEIEDDGSQSDEVNSDESDPDPNSEANAFKRKPLDPIKDFNEDGTQKFVLKTRLMMQLDKIDTDGECSDEVMDNSFGEQCSEDDSEEDEEEDEDDLDGDQDEVSPGIGGQQGNDQNGKGNTIGDEDGDEDEEEGEYDEESPDPSPIKPKKKVGNKQDNKRVTKTIFDIVKEPDSPERPKKRYRKSVMNVFCTEYDIVTRVARKYLGFRTKEYDEDHEGAIVGDQGGQKLSTDWDLTWHDLGITADFLSKMQPYQKVNQYPGMYVICRKNYLARNLMKMQRAFPDEYKFFPKTWLIPQEATDFRKQFVDHNGKPLQKKKTYIVKPEGLSQGQGIYLSRNCEKIIENCSAEGGYIVQDYLDKPHLVDDLKYDLRIYVMLYGLNPMRVYIHEQGLARFATEPYSAPKAHNIDNLYMHLTNYAINKCNAAFVQNQGGKGKKVPQSDEESEEGAYGSEEESGHKRSLHAILKILYQQGADADAVLDEIKDIIVKTLIVGQPYMSHIYRSCQPDDYDNSMCYQILGFDIMIDRNFKPWLIEVNQSPSFATDSPLDHEIKKQVLRDAFKLLNINQERRQKFIRMKQKQMAERILTGKQDRIEPEARKRLMEQRLAERFEFENRQMSRDRVQVGPPNRYELIFPDLYDEERNAHYETFIKKANDIWDEFTTGAKGKKRAAEAAAEKERAALEAKKMQQMKRDGKGNGREQTSEQLKKKLTAPMERQKTKNQAQNQYGNTNTQLTQHTEKSDDEGGNDIAAHREQHSRVKHASNHPQHTRLGQSISGAHLSKMAKSGVNGQSVPSESADGRLQRANNTTDNFNPGGGPQGIGPAGVAAGVASSGPQDNRAVKLYGYPGQNRNGNPHHQKLQAEQSPSKFQEHMIKSQQQNGQPSRKSQPGGGSGGGEQIRDSEMRAKQLFFPSSHITSGTQRELDPSQIEQSPQKMHLERRNLRSSQRRSNNNAPLAPVTINKNTSAAIQNFQSFASYKDQHSGKVHLDELRVADHTPNRGPVNPQGHFSGQNPHSSDGNDGHGFEQANQTNAIPTLSQRDNPHESQGSSLHINKDGSQKSRMSLLGNQQVPLEQSANNQQLRDMNKRHTQKQMTSQLAASQSKPPSRHQMEQMSSFEAQTLADVPASVASQRPKRVIYLENSDRKAQELLRSTADAQGNSFSATNNSKQAHGQAQAAGLPQAHNLQQLFGNKHNAQAGKGGGPFAGSNGGHHPSQQQLHLSQLLNPQLYQQASNTTYIHAPSQIPQNIFTHPARQQNFKGAAGQAAQGQSQMQYLHKTPQQKASSKFPGLGVAGARHGGGSGAAIPNQSGAEAYLQTLAHNNRVAEKNGGFKGGYTQVDPNGVYRGNQQAHIGATQSLIRQQIGSTVVNPPAYGNDLTVQHINGMEMNMHFNSNLQHMLQMGYSNNLKTTQFNGKKMRKDGYGHLSNQSIHQKSLHNGHVPNVLMGGTAANNYKHVIPLHNENAAKSSIQSQHVTMDRKAQILAGHNIMQNSQKLDVNNNEHFSSPYQNMGQLEETPKQKGSQLSGGQFNLSGGSNLFYQNPNKTLNQSKQLKQSKMNYRDQKKEAGSSVKDDIQLLMHLNKCTDKNLQDPPQLTNNNNNHYSITQKGLKFENQKFMQLNSNSHVLKNQNNTSFLVPQSTNFNPNRRTCK